MEEEKDKLKKEREKNGFAWSNCVSRIKRNWWNWIKGILVFLCIGGCIVVISMACAGWRIVYAPELEPDWDSISAVASWAGAIGTVAAVFSAIYVANQQNRIALFEKRYKIFETHNLCKIFSEILKRIDTKEEAKLAFVSVFCKMSRREAEKNIGLVMQQYVLVVEELKQVQFLYDDFINMYMIELLTCLEHVVNGSEGLWTDDKQRFIDMMDGEKYNSAVIIMGNKITLR